MSFSRVLSSICFQHRNMSKLIHNPAVKLKNTNSRISNTLLHNKARWFCSAEVLTKAKKEKIKITFVISKTGEKVDVEAVVGQNVMEVALEHNINMHGACEGYVSCTVCHIYVDEKCMEILPKNTEEEKDLLDRALYPKENSRLACTCVLNKDLDGAVFTLPLATRNLNLGEI